MPVTNTSSICSKSFFINLHYFFAKIVFFHLQILFFKMYKLIILIFTSTLIISCRYKDNDKIVLSTVKHRLLKTWYLKQYNLNDSDVIVTSYYKIVCKELKNNKLAITVNDNPLSNIFYLKNKKTEIVRPDDDKFLTITKLTNDELYLEGDRIFGMPGSHTNDIIKAKFSSKK